MNWFAGHRMLHEQNGSIVVLYLDQYLAEFSAELTDFGKASNYNNIEDSALHYVQKKMPSINVKQIKIMLGTLPLAKIEVNHSEQSAKAEQSDSSKSQTNYTVKAEDTLTRIANLYNTTVAALKSLNNLIDNKVYPGQRLKLYGEQQPQYIVRPGDNIHYIAGQFNVTVNHIKQANAVSDISIGQTLLIPRQEAENIANNLPDHLLTDGISGEQVSRLQRALYLCGSDVDVDGVFGEKTRLALLKLQKKYNLTASGVYDENLKRYLVKILLGNQRIVANPENTLVLVNKANRLSASFFPPDLVKPRVSYLTPGSDQRKLMRREAAVALERLFDCGRIRALKLAVSTAFQSYQVQERKFMTFANSYGLEQASQMVAKPGESEHQTGLAVNLTTGSDDNTLFQESAESKEYYELVNSFSQFGFIVRYPPGKEQVTGYQYEPGHFRYVGKTAAAAIQQKQLTLEEYLSV